MKNTLFVLVLSVVALPFVVANLLKITAENTNEEKIDTGQGYNSSQSLSQENEDIKNKEKDDPKIIKNDSKKEDFIEIGRRPPKEVLERFKKMKEERSKKLIEEKKEEEKSIAIKQKMLALEKPLEYIDEYQKRIKLYKYYNGKIDWDISSLSHVTSFNNSKKIHINTATFVNNINEIKQIEIFDANGDYFILKIKEVEEKTNNNIYTFVENSKHNLAIIVVDKNLSSMNGHLRLDGKINKLEIKENYGYVFN